MIDTVAADEKNGRQQETEKNGNDFAAAIRENVAAFRDAGNASMMGGWTD